MLERGEEREKGRETSMCGCLSHTPPLGTWPATQACALTGNWTGDTLVCRLALNPLIHNSQSQKHFLHAHCFHNLWHILYIIDHIWIGPSLNGLISLSSFKGVFEIPPPSIKSYLFWQKVYNLFYFLRYTLLIMLLQLSHFTPFIPFCPAHCLPPTFPLFSSCPWVVHISSLASPFPILFLTFPCPFSTYHLCYLFPVTFPPLSPSHYPHL